MVGLKASVSWPASCFSIWLLFSVASSSSHATSARAMASVVRVLA